MNNLDENGISNVHQEKENQRELCETHGNLSEQQDNDENHLYNYIRKESCIREESEEKVIRETSNTKSSEFKYSTDNHENVRGLRHNETESERLKKKIARRKERRATLIVGKRNNKPKVQTIKNQFQV